MFALIADNINSFDQPDIWPSLDEPSVERFDRNEMFFFQDRCAYWLMEARNATFIDMVWKEFGPRNGNGPLFFHKGNFPDSLKLNLTYKAFIRFFNELIITTKRKYQALILKAENDINITSSSQLEVIPTRPIDN